MDVPPRSRHTLRRVPWRMRPVLVTVVLLGVSMGVAPAASAVSTRAGRGRAVARAAKTLAFNINSNLHLIGRPGHVLNEHGTFNGSQSGTIEIRFTSVTHTSGEATFAAYSSHGGSVSGRATTKGHVVGATVYFTGSMTITGGTGRWAHASGKGLQFSGAVNRHTFNATTHMQGSISV